MPIVAGLIFVFTHGKPGVSCEIAVNGKTVLTVNFSMADTVFAMPENSRIRFKIRDNVIAFVESDCPDKVCIRSGDSRFGLTHGDDNGTLLTFILPALGHISGIETNVMSSESRENGCGIVWAKHLVCA